MWGETGARSEGVILPLPLPPSRSHTGRFPLCSVLWRVRCCLRVERLCASGVAEVGEITLLSQTADMVCTCLISPLSSLFLPFLVFFFTYTARVVYVTHRVQVCEGDDTQVYHISMGLLHLQQQPRKRQMFRCQLDMDQL